MCYRSDIAVMFVMEVTLQTKTCCNEKANCELWCMLKSDTANCICVIKMTLKTMSDIKVTHPTMMCFIKQQWKLWCVQIHTINPTFHYFKWPTEMQKISGINKIGYIVVTWTVLQLTCTASVSLYIVQTSDTTYNYWSIYVVQHKKNKTNPTTQEPRGEGERNRRL